MPSTSKKQHNFMEAVAHNPSFAKKVGIPQSVGKDFSTADKGKTFKQGGNMATMKLGSKALTSMPAFEKASRSKVNVGMGAKVFPKPEQATAAMKKGGMAKAAFEKSGKDVEKTGMKEGSKADMALDKKQMMGMKNGGMTKKYASGGSVASTATVNAGKKQSMNYDTKPGKKVSMSAALPRTMKPVKTNPGNINGVAAYGKTKGKTV